MRNVATDRCYLTTFDVEIFFKVREVVKGRGTLNHEFMLVDASEFRFVIVELILNITDQFLDDVIEEYYAANVTKLIGHQRHVRTFRKEKFQ